MLRLPFVFAVTLALFSNALSAPGELACRLVIPYNLSLQATFLINPIACTASTPVKPQYNAPIPDSVLFGYGTTRCPTCLGCSCYEGFTTTATLYDYSTGWRQDSARGSLNLARAALVPPSSSKPPAVSYYDQGFGPVLFKKADTTSICWITRGDKLLASSANHRIVHCLTRTDTLKTFSYATILQEIRPPIRVTADQRRGSRTTPVPAISHDVDGRRNSRCPTDMAPSFQHED